MKNNEKDKYIREILRLKNYETAAWKGYQKAKMLLNMIQYNSKENDFMLELANELINSLGTYENYDFIAPKSSDYDEIMNKILKFENEDIIITDPCYIMKEDSDDWSSKSGYGFNMEALGFPADKYVTSNTIYGDWSCTVFNTDTKEEIGNFCADAGLVSVFRLSDVLKYNPDFDYHINRPWTTALIKNFTGEVRIGFDIEEYEYEGELKRTMICYVEGEGSVNFISSQTGL